MRFYHHARMLLLATSGLTALTGGMQAQPSDPGFVDEHIVDVTGTYITAMQAMPDGRLLLGLRDGRILLYREGEPLPAPFYVVNTAQLHEGGIIGAALSPDFELDGQIYFSYTENRSGVVYITLARLTRSIGNPDVADPSSYEIIFSIVDASSSDVHFGGGILFGQDGHIYFGLGDDGFPNNSQNINNYRGAILRMTKDGDVPADNPMFGGVRNYLYAIGFRNPFRLYMDETTGDIYVSDTGQATAEEVNLLAPGMNYGWPIFEGPASLSPGTTPPANYQDPYFYYLRSGTPVTGVSVVDGFFYHDTKWPAQYQGRHFVADWQYNTGKVFLLADPFTPPSANASIFANTTGAVTDLVVMGGDLYYSTTSFDWAAPTTWNSMVRRVRYSGDALPTVSVSASFFEAPTPASFTLVSNVTHPNPGSLTRRWYVDGIEAGTSNNLGIFLNNPATQLVRLDVTNASGATVSWSGSITGYADRTLSNGMMVYDITNGSPIPANSTATLVRRLTGEPIKDSDGNPIVDIPITNGVISFPPSFRSDFSAVDLIVGTTGHVPRKINAANSTQFGLAITGTTAISENAVFGQFVNGAAETVPNVPFALSLIAGESAKSSYAFYDDENRTATSAADVSGYYYIPFTNEEAGHHFGVEAYPSGSADYLPKTANFTLPQAEDGLERVVTLSQADSATNCTPLTPNPAAGIVFSQIQAIFDQACLGCHGAASPYMGLDLREGFSYGRLVGQPSKEALGMNLVEPGDPYNSFLLEKMNCGNVQFGNPMPPTGLMPISDRQMIADWIAAGAQAEGTPTLNLFQTATSGSSPTQVEFRAGVTGVTPPFSVRWDFGDGFVGEGQTVRHGFYKDTAGAQNLTITATVIKNGATLLTDTMSYTLNGQVPAAGTAPTAAFASVPEIIREGSITTLDASASTAGTAPVFLYDWDFNNDGTVDRRTTDRRIDTYFPTAGTENVRLTVIDTQGRTATTTSALDVLVSELGTSVGEFNLYE